jgi:hypothetical protein
MARKTKTVATQSLAVVEKQTALAPMEPWEIELAEKATAARANESSGTLRIEHKSATLYIDGNKVKENKLKIIVLAYNFSKSYFSEAYDGSGGTPDCYAYGTAQEGEATMVPHEKSRDKQHDQCKGCPHNRFGTALQGNGKRCNDTRKLLCIVEVNDPESIKKSEVRMLSVPKGSLKNWGAYLDSIKDLSVTGSPSAVVTELSADPSEKAYVLTFKPIAKLSRDQAMAVIARGQQEEPKLFQPWPEIQKDEPTPAPARSRKANAKLK